jgi:hypothetical protein
VPSKTFHFGPDSEKVLEELVALYIHLSALTELLAGIVEEEGVDDRGLAALARSTIGRSDLIVAKAIRRRQ